jgi:hypothetical protein
VYIHRAEDHLDSRVLTQCLKVLSSVFLGETGLSRLTVLVIPASSGASDCGPVVQALSCIDAFRADKGVHTTVASLKHAEILPILMPYASKDLVLLKAQLDGTDGPQVVIETQIETCLGYCECDSVKLLLDEQAQRYHSELDTLRTGLKESLSQASQLSYALTQSELELTKYREEVAEGRGRLGNPEPTNADQQGEDIHALKDLDQHLAPYKNKIRSLKALLEEKDSTIADLAYAHEQTEQQLARSQEVESEARRLCQQIEDEYSD